MLLRCLYAQSTASYQVLLLTMVNLTRAIHFGFPTCCSGTVTSASILHPACSWYTKPSVSKVQLPYSSFMGLQTCALRLDDVAKYVVYRFIGGNTLQLISLDVRCWWTLVAFLGRPTRHSHFILFIYFLVAHRLDGKLNYLCLIRLLE